MKNAGGVCLTVIRLYNESVYYNFLARKQQYNMVTATSLLHFDAQGTCQEAEQAGTGIAKSSTSATAHLELMTSGAAPLNLSASGKATSVCKNDFS